MSGRIKLEYENRLEKSSKILKPGESFYHGPEEWLEMGFIDKGTTLLSFCSQEYNEDDYIRDYDVFKKVVSGNCLK